MNPLLKSVYNSSAPTCIFWQGRIRTATPAKPHAE